MRAEILSVAGVPLWVGKRQWVVKRAMDLAKLRLRFPSVGQLLARYGLAHDGDESEWAEIVWTRMDVNKPVVQIRFAVTETGEIRRE